MMDMLSRDRETAASGKTSHREADQVTGGSECVNVCVCVWGTGAHTHNQQRYIYFGESRSLRSTAGKKGRI